jgi:hypothetical protein
MENEMVRTYSIHAGNAYKFLVQKFEGMRLHGRYMHR